MFATADDSLFKFADQCYAARCGEICLRLYKSKLNIYTIFILHLYLFLWAQPYSRADVNWSVCFSLIKAWLLSLYTCLWYCLEVAAAVAVAVFSLMLVDISVLPSNLTSKSCYGDHLSIEKKGVRASCTVLALSHCKWTNMWIFENNNNIYVFCIYVVHI